MHLSQQNRTLRDHQPKIKKSAKLFFKNSRNDTTPKCINPTKTGPSETISLK